MIQNGVIIRRLHQAAPLISLAAALILPKLLPHDSAGADYDGAALAAVAAAVESVPYRVDEWVGRDVPIPETARRLLRPNAMLSRRYVHLTTGRRIDFSIVHCSDSRDMLGHYPPACYPANGWLSTSNYVDEVDVNHGSAVTLAWNDQSIPARMYHFSRGTDAANESHIRIFNFFVLPDGTVTRDVEDVGLRVNWLGARVQGVAQIQILTDQHMTFDDSADAAGEILEGVKVLLDSLRVRPNNEAPDGTEP